MIEIRGLTKQFDGFPALNGVDMNVRDGSIYGLVGTNGAGKTTILKLIAGILKQDGGDILVGNSAVWENTDVKAKLAFIPDDLSFYYSYDLNEVARFFSGLYPRWNPEIFDEVIDGFNLDRRNRLSRFSKGMQKQAVFALTLATTPEYLILDEPIDGLDPIVRKTIWRYIVGAAADRGMSTLVSSHNLREMEGFCDTIGIIDKGRMVLERDLEDLKTDIHKLQVSFGDAANRPEGVYGALNVMHSSSSGSVDYLIVRNDGAALDRFRAEKQPLIFDRVPLTLEEVFIYELGGASDAINNIL